MNTKNIFSSALLISLLGCVVFTGCKDQVELPDQPVDSYNRVYMPQAVNGPVNKTLSIKDEPQVLIYGVNFGGQNYPDKDISITFSVTQASADAYNTANKTDYKLLPEGSYTLSALKGVIPKGKLSTEPFRVSVKTKGEGAMEVLKTYILPISISTNDATVNESLRTTYYIVKAQPDVKDYPNFDRSAWKVLGISSEETTGEGANNGRAIFAIDNNPETFWHSRWSNGAALPPHFISIDMGAVRKMHGLGFVARQNDGGGKPNQVNVETSLDNVTWVNVASFNLQDTRNLQTQFLPGGFDKEARYFKVIVNSAYNSTVTQIAELYAF